MSLLYVDLDHFKSINDAAGHAAGDELLRQIAHLMQSRIRDTDILARMGGNEFAVVLKACPEGKAENIAQDIQARIDSFRFQWEGNAFDVGASIGVVHVPAHWTTLDECLAAVDAACYKAKQNGHGKVVVHRQIEGSS
jgi:diguanylate cyclase (GGDEF)-like protein